MTLVREAEPFEQYGAVAASLLPAITVAARYRFQAKEIPRTVADIAEKLDLDQNDSLLEIGCGPGLLLNPLSCFVGEATGLDHRAMRGYLAPLVKFIPGPFPLTQVTQHFDKVLIYSVLHYCRDFNAATDLVLAAAKLLRPHGKMLVGDIPNADKKAALDSAAVDEWMAKIKNETLGQHFKFDSLVRFDDASIELLADRLRQDGFKAERLAQDPRLPFGLTREDILVTAGD